ncbi:MAG: ABC transporter ATP-binding protein/permease [Bifidobacteriaceae bacterium]|jgi:ATP-binding cassette subfamily B protein|nr:ABC transporter ATP-binding protein/permease [Bifidobacteriaceae bacterium]
MHNKKKQPAAKAMNFGPTLKRLIGDLCVQKFKVFIVLVFLVAAALSASYAPKVLGHVTDVLFEGLISKQMTEQFSSNLPAGVTIDDIKPKVSNDEGYLDVDKLQEFMDQAKSGANALGGSTGMAVQFDENGNVITEGSAGSSADASAGTDSGSHEASAGSGSSSAEVYKSVTATAPIDGSSSSVITDIQTGTPPDSSATNSSATDENSSDDSMQNLDQTKQMLSKMNITLGGSLDYNKFLKMIGWATLIYLFGFLSRWIAGWITVRIVTTTVRDLRMKIEEKIWKLPLKYFDGQTRGEIMSRLINDLDNLSQILFQVAGDFIFMVLMVSLVIGMMFSLSVSMTLIALLSIPASMILIVIIMKKSGPQFARQWKMTGSLNSLVEESFSGVSLVKTYNQEQEFIDRFHEQNDELYEATFKAQFLSGIIMPINVFFTNFMYALIAFIGAVRIIHGQLSLGDLQSFIMYVRQYSQPIGQLSQMVNQIQSGVASAERVYEILDEDDEPMQEHNPDLEFNKKAVIDFKNVNFGYTEDKPLIKDFSLSVRPGKTIAIVGHTGAGKTTIVNLLMRFYDINSGKILIDNKDTANINRQDLREHIAMVLQDPWIFKGSIRDNIMFGCVNPESVTEKQFEKACESAHVKEFAKKLKHGYDTIIGGENDSLSAGEKQLIVIARALIADRQILILDEATSSVDTRTELLIQNAMNKLSKDRTSFVIAHRLSTIREADLIIVVDGGNIIEQGNHNELIKEKGYYYNIYNSQFE